MQWLVVVAVGPRLLACHCSDQQGFGEEVDCDPSASTPDQPGAALLPLEPSADVTSIAFSDDGLLLAVGDAAGSVSMQSSWLAGRCSARDLSF